jgi:hypothetical protein
MVHIQHYIFLQSQSPKLIIIKFGILWQLIVSCTRGIPRTPREISRIWGRKSLRPTRSRDKRRMTELFSSKGSRFNGVSAVGQSVQRIFTNRGTLKRSNVDVHQWSDQELETTDITFETQSMLYFRSSFLNMHR